MAVAAYEYSIQSCDIPASRRALLEEYRRVRLACLESLHGDSATSVMNQIHDLTWHTAVFRTLNESRRLEKTRDINGAMWELITAGYASLMTLGIRRLVDRDDRTDSLWGVINRLEKRPELLTRELFICYDGLPFDSKAGHANHIKSIGLEDAPIVRWLPTTGPGAWTTSDIMHKAFDSWISSVGKRKRLDKIPVEIFSQLKTRLGHPAIKIITTIADRQVAHSERLSEDVGPHLEATYNDVNTALAELVRIANYLSGRVFYDQVFGTVVAVPQFDVLRALDQPWVTSANLPLLHQYWDDVSAEMDRWVNDPLDISIMRDEEND